MDTAFTDNYRFLAQYNRWFNERLYAACEGLSDEERKRDRGAFFGSIHNTLNHLIWGDQTWLRRFAVQGVDFASLSPDVLDLPEGTMHGTVLYESWEALRAKRAQLDSGDHLARPGRRRSGHHRPDRAGLTPSAAFVLLGSAA